MIGLALHLQELADRCKTIGRADRILDWMIHAAADQPDTHLPAAYTASMDAAMTLFPQGLQFIEMNLSWDTVGCWPAVGVRWYPPDHDGKNWHACVSSGATSALALCNAALTIRSRQLIKSQRPEGK
ncbi:hypothetical protein [Bradyrhizobium sp. JYMT SZCCT0428]|uniref:hypothetical protein n=1 Tax=Bradyrhizobium sp. JYMT SZCCT0428 TaxID=2807673 RepID=UPI001BAABA14|nr:hypothetical protein [Bradyrhizobium sp. JYMT SZCCT0428]MBR1150114.1 hypothetical protein [Bradyrhizobium sp. JYMT SZCCT0428]